MSKGGSGKNSSGRQACGVNLSAKHLPHGGADTTSKSPSVYIRTFGWPFVSSLQCSLFVL